MIQRIPYSPERISIAIGLCVMMVSTLPRYMAGGHETHQTLLLIALAFVASAAVLQWRMLSTSGRKALPVLIKRLSMMMVAGTLIMGAWHALFTDWISWQVFISHASTAGLLLHAISLWWAKQAT